MPTSPPLKGPVRSMGAGYTHSNGALKQIRLARTTCRQWLITLATHLVLSAVFFPTYLLTFHASGGYYIMIRDITGPMRAEYPACDSKPNVSRDTETDLEDIRKEMIYDCWKLFKGSLSTMLVCVAASQLLDNRAHTFFPAVALTSVEGLYLSYAVKRFVHSVAKPPCQSPIGYWTATQRSMASTVMAIPEAHILWYYIVAAFCILWYFGNPLVAPSLDFLHSFATNLREEIRQIQPILALDTGIPIMRGIAIILASIRIALVRVVFYNLERARPCGGRPNVPDP